MTTATKQEFILSDETKREIDHWLSKFPKDQRRSASLPSLLAVQEQNEGWLSTEAMDAVADYIGLAKIEIYEVATFYDMYELQPVGKHKIAVCTNVSCMLRGSDKILAAIKHKLDIAPGETTQDNKFFLREVECLGACGGAPMCQINDGDYHENITPEKIVSLIDELDQE